MAVFISASDESAGRDRQDQFVLAGFIASERDWSEIFCPAWQGLVLDGPPAIPYLHMTDIRSPKWRTQHGLADQDASSRVDRAVNAIGVADFLIPLGLKVSGADIREAFAGAKVRPASGQRKTSAFEPDYLCFLGYAMLALFYVANEHPECEKLDFLVERNGKITDYIRDFHDSLGENFTALGRPDLARLVGELLPVGKDRIPVQAADVLCWHTARNRSAMDDNDYRRYEKLARKNGRLESFNAQSVNELANILHPKG
jgi:hypothetical protein